MTKLDERPEVTLDFELMFGEMPELPCESENHGKSSHHDDGPGRHYWRILHSCDVMQSGTIYVLCKRRSEELMLHIALHPRTHCVNCGSHVFTNEWVEYIGPVGL